MSLQNVFVVLFVTILIWGQCWSSIIIINALFWLMVLRWIIPQSSKITFMAFAMIGANIIPAVAIIREKSNRKGRKNSNHWLYCVKNDTGHYKSISCSFASCHSIHQTSFCKGVKSNPGSHLFPIWWDECICGWSNTKSGTPGSQKWQVEFIETQKV